MSRLSTRAHRMGCRCAKCFQPHPSAPALLTWIAASRAAQIIAGCAIGILIVLILAAAGGPSPLVIIGHVTTAN